MRILLVRHFNPYFETSASGNRYSGLIDGLIKEGVSITLIITGGFQSYKEFVDVKSKRFNNVKFIYTTFTINNNIWLRRINTYIIPWFSQLLTQIRLKIYFKSNYDIVWLTNSIEIMNSYRKYNHLVKGKTMIELNEFNDNYKNKGLIGNKFQFHKALKADKLFLSSICYIDMFAVMTKTLIAHYKKYAKSDAKFLHLPMTVDLKRFSDINNTNTNFIKPYIAYTGTYNNAKDGVDILIHAFASIINDYPEYKLYLAGFYYYDVQMQKKIISQYNLNERIIHIGILGRDEIPAFLLNADLLVLSRPDSAQAQGGFPTKLGEYLSTGNPVCVTRVGEIPDYLEDNVSAFFAEPGSIDSFASAMKKALSDNNNAKRVGLNGKKVAEDVFNIDIQTKRLFEFMCDNLSIDIN